MEPLAEFPPTLAAAVVTVLRRAGVPATLGDPVAGTSDVSVLVPGDRRGDALTALAIRMEEVREEAEAESGSGARAEDDAEEPAPLVMERLRNLGVVAMVLTPLLIITLAAPGMPMWLAIVIYIGVLAVVVALRAHTGTNPD